MRDRNTRQVHQTVTYLIAGIWLVNGLLCKVLNLVPRHQLIVSRILGGEYAGLLTKAIGVAEILLAIWIISLIKARLCALVQITMVAVMNIVEFWLVPDLLLFGRANAIFATIFIGLVYYHEFVLNQKAPLHG